MCTRVFDAVPVWPGKQRRRIAVRCYLFHRVTAQVSESLVAYSCRLSAPELLQRLLLLGITQDMLAPRRGVGSPPYRKGPYAIGVGIPDVQFGASARLRDPDVCHPGQIGDDEKGERLGELANELAPARVDDLVELAVGQRVAGRKPLDVPMINDFSETNSLESKSLTYRPPRPRCPDHHWFMVMAFSIKAYGIGTSPGC